MITDFQDKGYGTQQRPSKNAPNVQSTLVPNDMPRHKHNIRSGAGYANVVAILQRNEDILKNTTHYIHHILHSEIGKKCGYNQLFNNKIPGQSPANWRTSFANELGRLAN